MRLLLTSVFCLFFGVCCQAVEPEYRSLPERQRALLDKTIFELRLLPPTALFPANDLPANLSKNGLLLFVCSAREPLGRVLLWIDAEVEFSNGYKRTFQAVHLGLDKGSVVAVSVLDFVAGPDLKIKSFTITSAVAK